MPKVSIIITTYNYGQYVAQAIDSALAQTYSDIEVVVVDDGSSDNTAEVVKAYRGKIDYYHQSNAGVVVARNSGIDRASGEYLCFLDADDYLDADYIRLLMQAVQNCSGTCFAYGDIRQFEAAAAHLKAGPWDTARLLWSNFVGLSAVVPKEIFDRLGGYDVEFNRSADFEDWDFWLKVAENGYQGVYVPQASYYYRITAAVSRNRMGWRQKLGLRYHLLTRHGRLYLQPLYLLRSPFIVLHLIVKKTAYRRSATVAS